MAKTLTNEDRESVRNLYSYCMHMRDEFTKRECKIIADMFETRCSNIIEGLMTDYSVYPVFNDIGEIVSYQHI